MTKNTTVMATTLERMMLRAYFLTDYGDGPGTDTWTFDVISYSGIPAKQARGVMSSLVKKGMIFVAGPSKEVETYLTPDGIAFCAYLGISRDAA